MPNAWHWQLTTGCCSQSFGSTIPFCPLILALLVLVAGLASCATYFVTAGTYNKTNLLQSDRMAKLFCRRCFTSKLKVHSFVVMPNHVHLLITVPEGMTLERAFSTSKAGSPFHAGKLLNRRGPNLAEKFC
jgi:hypothetical protein